jgi:predicted phage gp36 major capsid-like protein
LTDVKRVMRDEFEEAAEEFRQSLNRSVESAKRGAGTSAAQRDSRTQALTERLTTLRQFADAAQALAAGPGPQ